MSSLSTASLWRGLHEQSVFGAYSVIIYRIRLIDIVLSAGKSSSFFCWLGSVEESTLIMILPAPPIKIDITAICFAVFDAFALGCCLLFVVFGFGGGVLLLPGISHN